MEVIFKSIHSSIDSNRKILLMKYIIDGFGEKNRYYEIKYIACSVSHFHCAVGYE